MVKELRVFQRRFVEIYRGVQNLMSSEALDNQCFKELRRFRSSPGIDLEPGAAAEGGVCCWLLISSSDEMSGAVLLAF